MATFSKKVMGKEVGDASVYAAPHTMSGAALTDTRPNKSKLDTYDVSIGNISKSAGDEEVKTSGIQMRGTGCATKGKMSRGPMA